MLRGAGCALFYALLHGVLLLCSAPAAAFQVPDLATVDESVPDRSEQERGAALARALDRVLARLTGHAPDALPSRAAALRRRPEQHLVSDFYVKPEPDPGKAWEGVETPPVLYLRARFQLSALEQALRASGVPVLGSSRPRVLTWVLVNEATGTRFLVNAETEPYATALRAQAAELGMPILLPLLDLEDSTRVAASDLLYVHQAVLKASERYGAAGVLILVLQETPESTPESTPGSILESSLEGRWQGRWSWYAGDAPGRTWESTGPVLAPALRGGLLHLAGQVVQRYGALHELPRHLLEVHLLDTDSFPRYVRALTYLESLDLVEGVQVLGVEGQRLDLLLEMYGGLEELREKIRLDDVLHELPGRAGAWFRIRR